jgi:hypothetical protein
MADSKRQQSGRQRAETAKPEKAVEPINDNKKDPAPGESIEGEGSPGLSILGGGGHA